MLLSHPRGNKIGETCLFGISDTTHFDAYVALQSYGLTE